MNLRRKINELINRKNQKENSLCEKTLSEEEKIKLKTKAIQTGRLNINPEILERYVEEHNWDLKMKMGGFSIYSDDNGVFMEVADGVLYCFNPLSMESIVEYHFQNQPEQY